jgi:hypothetical protein
MVDAPTNSGDDLIAQIAAATIRHVASGLAGTLVTVGALQKSDQAHFSTMLSGVGLWAAMTLWSYIQKRNAARGKSG